MNFDFDDSEKSLCDKIRTLFPERNDMDGEPYRRTEVLKSRNDLLKNLKALSDLGYFHIGVENGRNSISLAKARETVASASPSLFLSVEMSVRIFGTLIELYGTSQQKEDLLPALKGGGLIGAVGLTETGMSMEKMSMETAGTAVEGSIILSGRKPYVLNGPIADLIAVAGRYEAEEAGGWFFSYRQGKRRSPDRSGNSNRRF